MAPLSSDARCFWALLLAVVSTCAASYVEDAQCSEDGKTLSVGVLLQRGTPALNSDSQEDRLEALLTSHIPGVTVDAPEAIRHILSQGRPKYFLSVNTGHAGSTSMSQREAYEGEGLAEVHFTFENLGYEAKDHVHRAWQEWWKTGHRESNVEEVRRKVRDEYKARIDEMLAKNHQSSYVDLGHHTLNGIFHQIPSLFLPNVAVLRLRRDRYHTAFSFIHSGWADMCDITYGICPLRDEVVLRPAGQEWSQFAWHEVGITQQSLWYVDELEAEWQTLVKQNPDLPRVECDWSTRLDFCFQAVALLLKVDVAHGGQGVKKNAHTKCGKFEKELDALVLEDEKYKAFMSYSQQDQDLIARAQAAGHDQSLLQCA
mmetsp:Transcript_7936/g.17602  ORF Transcript_7936/g.17602 Transcript_7936/m.17602 type:complete len:372 (+) Transcript_7936:213-1328(+)|eukprot:CAMPEP_0178431658 /NCGR_PEP_ID=MMETSP0689_2-20121128/31970_1 /TAXON_ID=160604 /ORGANISM="Amphidinium massartii, Strain CS-259" /LENGTH=371 /DNA_ID=CAMNT_0020053595 /DNA_START=133 /DNA_END=1248 /DNA_ORIENTATION=+